MKNQLQTILTYLFTIFICVKINAQEDENYNELYVFMHVRLIMKVLKSGKRYITIVIKSNNVEKEIQLAYDQNLTPSIIDGNGKINNNLLKVPALGTLVVIWQ